MKNKPFQLGQNLKAALFIKHEILCLKHEILNETYPPWVKKLGQWHLADDDGKTRCGVPMLGNNYAKYIPENERTKCPKCFE